MGATADGDGVVEPIDDGEDSTLTAVVADGDEDAEGIPVALLVCDDAIETNCVVELVSDGEGAELGEPDADANCGDSVAAAVVELVADDAF